MRLPLVLAALAVMLLGASCGQKHEPIGALPPFPQQADDAMGREVKVLQAPKRVVSLDPGITEAAFSYGAGKQIVGGTGTETYPPAATHVKSMLDAQGKISVEKVRKARPDLVIVPAELIGSIAAAADSLGLKAGADVYVTDDRSVQGIEHDILQTGLLTGHGAASHRPLHRDAAQDRRDPFDLRRRSRGAGVRRPRLLLHDRRAVAGGRPDLDGGRPERGRRRRYRQAVRPGQAAPRRRRRCTWPWRPAA